MMSPFEGVFQFVPNWVHLQEGVCVCVCWQVQATHKYVGEDLDELTFEPDEIITVVPFDDPEEQVNQSINHLFESGKTAHRMN